MPTIQPSDARGIFTKALIALYNERVSPLNFGRSFFPTETTDTLEVSIEVMRDSEKVAVDVIRGANGNRNKFSRSSEKIFIPPYYREYFDQTDLDLYDRVFGSSGANPSVRTMSSFVETVSMKYAKLQDKIERAYEKQCWEVLEDGIVQLNSGDNIDFKRKSGSLVDRSSANPWSTSTNDALGDIGDAGDFIRNVGKSRGGRLNVVMGKTAFNAFMANDELKERGDLRRINLVDINSPQANASGGTFHGQFSAGNFICNLWTYDEIYEDADGNQTPFVNEKKVIVLPENPMFRLGFGAVPKLMDTGNQDFPQAIQNVEGAFVFGDYIDPRAHSHIFDIQSAGVAIPVAVDQIYTMQVIA